MGKSKELAELGQVVSQSGGNVGIGADSPTEALHIAKAFPAVKLDNIDAGGHSWRIASGSTNSGFAGKLQIYNEDTSTIAAYIDASGRVTMPYQPSVGGRRFNQKYGANAYVVTGVNLTLVDIYANTGNAWNNTTGIFLCPVAGKYLVQANLLQDDAAGSSTLCRASFRINGVETYMGYDNSRTGTGYDGMVSFGGVLSCQANDQISIQVTSGTIHWSNESAFSIALIG